MNCRRFASATSRSLASTLLEVGAVLADRQAGSDRREGGLVVGLTFCRLGETGELFQLRVRQVAVDVEQGVVQVVADGVDAGVAHQADALDVLSGGVEADPGVDQIEKALPFLKTPEKQVLLPS